MQNNEMVLSKIDKKEKKAINWLYPSFIGAFSFLFYKGEFGLSIPIFTLLFLVIQFVRTPNRHRKILWWFGATSLMLASIGILRFGNTSSYWAFALAFVFNSSTVLKSDGVSVITSFTHFFKSFGQGIATLWIDMIKRFSSKTKEKEERGNKRLMTTGIGFVVLLIFFMIYKTISPEFNLWVNKIDLDFISIPWVITFILSFLFMYGIYNKYFASSISLWERRIKRNISMDRNDHFEKYFSLRQEKMLSISVLVLLNLMIASVLFFDISRYVQNGSFVSGLETYTNAVHTSVNLLIFSIILAVSLIGLSLRGRLNFLSKKEVKSLAILWMILNIGLVVIAGFKNYEYISHYGLTYKRMGVFMYLTLTIVGLLFTILKITTNSTILSLVRKVSLAFFILFMASTQVNWDVIITKFNLNEDRFTVNQIDFNYMSTYMGEDAQILLYQYLVDHNDPERAMDLMQYNSWRFENELEREDWRELTLDKMRYDQYFFIGPEGESKLRN